MAGSTEYSDSRNIRGQGRAQCCFRRSLDSHSSLRRSPISLPRFLRLLRRVCATADHGVTARVTTVLLLPVLDVTGFLWTPMRGAGAPPYPDRPPLFGAAGCRDFTVAHLPRRRSADAGERSPIEHPSRPIWAESASSRRQYRAEAKRSGCRSTAVSNVNRHLHSH